jgi:hypothetical protein
MIEHWLGAGAGMLPNPQSPAQHLEHIFPRNPAQGEWPPIEKAELGLIVNRIGNLLVLEADINKHIKNKSYAYKKQNSKNLDYTHSALQMPRKLEDFEEDGSWGRSSIEKRQEALAYDAVKVWPLADSGRPPEDSSETA